MKGAVSEWQERYKQAVLIRSQDNDGQYHLLDTRPGYGTGGIEMLHDEIGHVLQLVRKPLRRESIYDRHRKWTRSILDECKKRGWVVEFNGRLLDVTIRDPLFLPAVDDVDMRLHFGAALSRISAKSEKEGE